MPRLTMKLHQIERYSANHPDWEGSFSERLYEHSEWNIPEFWKLHKELIDLAIELKKSNEINKKLVGQLLGIQKSITTMVIAHFNKNDSVTLSGVTDDLLYEFMERFDMAITGISSGQVLGEDQFDLMNPLIKSI